MNTLLSCTVANLMNVKSSRKLNLWNTFLPETHKPFFFARLREPLARRNNLWSNTYLLCEINSVIIRDWESGLENNISPIILIAVLFGDLTLLSMKIVKFKFKNGSHADRVFITDRFGRPAGEKRVCFKLAKKTDRCSKPVCLIKSTRLYNLYLLESSTE
jgi:hypothetical protein